MHYCQLQLKNFSQWFGFNEYDRLIRTSGSGRDTYTRPNIAKVVGTISQTISQFMTNLSKEYWNTVQRIIKYTGGTSDVCYIMLWRIKLYYQRVC